MNPLAYSLVCFFITVDFLVLSWI
uniref:Uncharacterized protein n=1 Tax=Rhizophora mucronata TaxID=61149 RepID=A0A2P2N065_RHIMU